MTDVQTLTILLGQNERQRDAALAEHQRAQAAAEAARAQAEQLRGYRRDYEQRWSAQFCREGKIELVRCYQSFMERLTLAVEQQARIADHAAQQVERMLTALREAELRCASVRKLIERRVAEQRLATERRDQKQTDEAATRAAWNRLGSTRPAPLM
ncbi:MAG: flagellar export protein FliJ [Pseudomonadota bacterium]